jgi:hypothetical protein
VVTSQIEKECISREPTLVKYLALVRRVENYFKGFIVEHIDRNKNAEANDLEKVVAQKTALPLDVFFQTIEDASVKIVKSEPRLINAIERQDWRAPIMAYLHQCYEPDSNTDLIRIEKIAKPYQVINNELYQTSPSLFEQGRRRKDLI